MAVILALVEMSAIFVAVCGVLFVSLQPLLTSWTGATGVAIQGLAVSVSCVVAFYLNNLYDLRSVPSFVPFASRLPASLGIALLLLGGFYLLLPRSVAGDSFVWSGLIALGFVLPLRGLSYAAIRSRPFAERVLIVGAGPLAHRLIDEIHAQPHVRYAVAGVVDDAAATAEPAPVYRRLGPLQRLCEIIETVAPDRIIVALAERRGRLPMAELLVQCRTRGIAVEDAVAVYERLTGKVAIESVTPSSLVFSKDFLKPRLYLLVARVVSVVAAIIGLLVLGPFLGLIALAVKLDSRGPVFFLQKRVGFGGRRFNLVKFRTMHPAAHATSEWVHDNGDRITRVGKWLRRFRLDELPQFVNILHGDMNLVGPRPHPATNVDLFASCIPHYSLRAVVRPGVTGWAQVRYGYANNLEEETEKMRYDLYYIKHMSPWFDLRILFDTVKTVLHSREPLHAGGERSPGSRAALGKAA